VTYTIDIPRAYNRGCRPLHTQPHGNSLMTTKVVKMSEGNHLYNMKYSSHTHHTWQGWREDMTCQNQGCHNGHLWMKMSVRTSFSSGRPPVSAFTRGRGCASGRPRGHRPARMRKKLLLLLLLLLLYFLFFFGSCCRLGKREKIYNLQFSVFGFQSPKSPESPKSPKSPKSPNSPSSAGEAARRRRFFRPSSPSHPSKLYSSLGWLNSKVPKPFPPFSIRLIDVDGF
jgi:hypothetical protein